LAKGGLTLGDIVDLVAKQY